MGETTDQDEAREHDQIDAMQRSLTRLRRVIGEQRRAVADGQRGLDRQQRGLDVTERFEVDLQQNIDIAQGMLDHPATAAEDGTSTPRSTPPPAASRDGEQPA